MATPTSVFPFSESPTILPFRRGSGFWHCFISTTNKGVEIHWMLGLILNTSTLQCFFQWAILEKALTTSIQFPDFLNVQRWKIVSLAYHVLFDLRKLVVPRSVHRKRPSLGIGLVLGKGCRGVMHDRRIVVVP